jgi:hypothetical protein
LFEEAMTLRKQILCTYHGRLRELCPIILGHSQGREKALTYQFHGQSNKGLPPGGQWRCLWLSEVSNVRLRDGPWHAGDSHNQPQGCVDVVHLDVNPASPTAQNAASKSGCLGPQPSKRPASYYNSIYDIDNEPAFSVLSPACI